MYKRWNNKMLVWEAGSALW